MYRKLCVVLLLLIHGSTRGVSEFIPPPYSLQRILGFGLPQATSIFRNNPSINVPLYVTRTTKIHNEHTKNTEKHQSLKHSSAIGVQDKKKFSISKSSLLKVASNRRQTLDFRVHNEKTRKSTVRDTSYSNHSVNTFDSFVTEQIHNQSISNNTESKSISMVNGSTNKRIVSTKRPVPDHTSAFEPDVNSVLPNNLCNRCPVDSQGHSKLFPCTCVGNTGGTSFGKISITCPDTIQDTDHLKWILTGADYITTQVARFTLQNSKVEGIIEKDLWGDLQFVQVLLDNNKFRWVDNKAFIGSNETIHYLSLKHNNLQYFVTGSYNELPYLETLDLSYNELPYIYTDAFTYKSLKYLDLSHNAITDIGSNSFSELDSVITLNLSTNQLTILEENAFYFTSHTHLEQIFVLDVSNNNISQISDTAFSGLSYVDLRLINNQLKSVQQEVFEQVLKNSQYDAHISVSGNPIICDCDVFWIRNSTQNLASFDNFRCNNYGKTIAEIQIEEFSNCTNFHRVHLSLPSELYEIPSD